jgi:hypothetical protein
MVWSKMKQQLESYLCPALVGRVEYRATGYRYLSDKAGRCYITVDKREVFNMSDVTTNISWYQTEQEIKNDPNVKISVSDAEIDALRKETYGKVPEQRLAVIVANRKITDYAKEILAAQAVLSKSYFYRAANTFLSCSIEESLGSNEILLNIFALVDRRVGKKRLLNMSESIHLKHPIVQYFYQLRCSS